MDRCLARRAAGGRDGGTVTTPYDASLDLYAEQARDGLVEVVAALGHELELESHEDATQMLRGLQRIAWVTTMLEHESGRKEPHKG